MKRPPEGRGGFQTRTYTSRQIRFGAFTIFFFLLLVGALLGAQSILRVKVAADEFKHLAEATVSHFLKANVRIAAIELNFLNQVTLRGLEIDPAEGAPAPYLFEVDKVIFQYHPIQLLTAGFKKPSSIQFNAPTISWQKAEFPYDLFQGSSQGGAFPSRLEMAKGEARFAVAMWDTEIQLREIQGSYEATAMGQIRVDFRTQVTGLVTGRVRVRGQIDPLRRTHDLTLDLESVRISREWPLPLESLDGQMRLKNGNFFLDAVRTKIHGWQTDLSGSLGNLTAAGPLIQLEGRMGKDSPLAYFDIKADFAAGQLTGKVKLAGQKEFPFQGRLHREGKILFFDSVKGGENYDAKGELNFISGDYWLEIEKETQRIFVTSNLDGMKFRLNVNLHHVPFFGLDLVTSARVRLSPGDAQWEHRNWKFYGSFETDYFILEYAPFEDFRGSFEMTPHGIRNFKSSWGKVFRMDGKTVLGTEGPEAKLTLWVNGFDLKDVRSFAAKPLPKRLEGLLEGRLKVEGPLTRPEVAGNFKIKKGVIGKLEYDQARIQFRGMTPYLPLYDSYLLKGRSSLDLTGAMDLSLPNIFRGIKIQSSDKLILWHGWELSMHQAEQDGEIDRSRIKFPTLAFGTSKSKRSDTLPGETESSQEDPTFAVGPKFKF